MNDHTDIILISRDNIIKLFLYHLYLILFCIYVGQTRTIEQHL